MINPGILVRETYYGNLIDQKNKKVKALLAKINDVVYKDWGSDIQLDGLHAWRIVPDLANMFLSSYPDMQYYETYCRNLIDQQNKKVKALEAKIIAYDNIAYDNATFATSFLRQRLPRLAQTSVTDFFSRQWG